MSVSKLARKKRKGEKISVATCYDWSFARILNESDLDAILVGDSAAMVMQGYPETARMTLDAAQFFVESVARGAPDKFIIADVPFGWAHKDATAFMEAVSGLVRAGAQAIKVEGVGLQNDNIARAIDAGIPVVGHLGLTPQHINKLGGYKLQGKSDVAIESMLQELSQLKALGCFAVVFECITSEAAQALQAESEGIVTIGIGAGASMDGQVLVLQDLLGMTMGRSPRFVRKFANVGEAVSTAVSAYVGAVRDGSFPAPEESYE
ncbi:MAG: 3-methyl-2-oxobutanoate hydroxymethyltransferase [Opitutales bacterium]